MLELITFTAVSKRS